MNFSDLIRAVSGIIFDRPHLRRVTKTITANDEEQATNNENETWDESQETSNAALVHDHLGGITHPLVIVIPASLENAFARSAGYFTDSGMFNGMNQAELLVTYMAVYGLPMLAMQRLISSGIANLAEREKERRKAKRGEMGETLQEQARQKQEISDKTKAIVFMDAAGKLLGYGLLSGLGLWSGSAAQTRVRQLEMAGGYCADDLAQLANSTAAVCDQPPAPAWCQEEIDETKAACGVRIDTDTKFTLGSLGFTHFIYFSGVIRNERYQVEYQPEVGSLEAKARRVFGNRVIDSFKYAGNNVRNSDAAYGLYALGQGLKYTGKALAKTVCCCGVCAACCKKAPGETGRPAQGPVRPDATNAAGVAAGVAAAHTTLGGGDKEQSQQAAEAAANALNGQGGPQTQPIDVPAAVPAPAQPEGSSLTSQYGTPPEEPHGTSPAQDASHQGTAARMGSSPAGSNT